MIKLGANTVLFAGYDLETALKHISWAGYDGAELSAIQGMCEHLDLDNWKAQAADIKALAQDYELALTYIGEAGYTQHNPGAKDGVEGMKGFIGFLKSKYPDNHSEIKRIFAEGDYVITHVHAVREPGTRGNAIVDIFRLDDKGKVVEHWDAVQPIPEEAMNDNTMF